MPGFATTETIWMNGRLVPWAEAKVHVLAHGLQYGTGVFEGLRCYPTADGPAVFRLDAHLERLFASAALYDIVVPYTTAELAAATLEVVRSNKLETAYIRPVVFVDAYTLALWTAEAPVSVAIAGFPQGAYLAGADAGVRITVSPIRRFNSDAIPATGKACGQYINSLRAVNDARRRGFDEALLLNTRGEVAEGSGENLFLVRHGRLRTNGADADILMGITRDAVLTLARDLGIASEVAPISLDDVLAADEVFFTGTAVEVTPVRELDGHVFGGGRPGPITRQLQQRLLAAARGERPEYRHWLAYAAAPAATR